MKPTPQQIRERNEAWAKALEQNPKKCVGQMRDGQGGRCCLAVAQDVARELGMKDLGLDMSKKENDAILAKALEARKEEARQATEQYLGDTSTEQSLSKIKGIGDVSDSGMPDPTGDEEVDAINREEAAQKYPSMPIQTEYRRPDINKVLPFADVEPAKSVLDYMQTSEKMKATNKAEPQAGSTFEPGTKEYELAKKIAGGQLTYEQGLASFVGFGNKTGKREDLVNTIFEIG